MSKTYSNIYCGKYWGFSVTPTRLLKTQMFGKKAVFPVKKKLTKLSRIIESDIPQGAIYKQPEGILVFTVEVLRSFFRT